MKKYKKSKLTYINGKYYYNTGMYYKDITEYLICNQGEFPNFPYPDGSDFYHLVEVAPDMISEE